VYATSMGFQDSRLVPQVLGLICDAEPPDHGGVRECCDFCFIRLPGSRMYLQEARSSAMV
jgi:hypothetical protein